MALEASPFAKRRVLLIEDDYVLAEELASAFVT